MPRPSRPSRPGQNDQPPKGRLHALLAPMLGSLFGGEVPTDPSTIIGPSEASATPSIDPEDSDLGLDDSEIDTSVMGQPPTLATNTNQPSINTIGNIQSPGIGNRPGWTENLLSGFKARPQYDALKTRLGIDQYNNLAKEALLQQTSAGRIAALNAKNTNELGLLNTRIPLEQQSQIAVNEAKNKGEMEANTAKVADSYGLTSDELHQYLGAASRAKLTGEQRQQDIINSVMGTPDGGTALVNNWYTGQDKQGVDNILSQANAAKANADAQSTIASLPTKPFLQLPSGDSAINPNTGQAFFNSPSSVNPFEVKGGPTMTGNIPVYGVGGGPRRSPGGAAALLGSGGSNPSSIVPMQPTNNSQSSLPYFSPATPAPNNLPAAYQPYASSIVPPPPQITPQLPTPTQSGMPDTNSLINNAISQYLRRLQFPNGFPQ